MQFITWNNQYFIFTYNPRQDLGHEASSPLSPTFNADNQVTFSLFEGKTRYSATLIRGDGGCVIQLKWPGLPERDMQGISQ